MAFDPSAPAGPGTGIFGLPHQEADAKAVIIPVPWEATTSYGGGTSSGPDAVFRASRQVDLFDIELKRPYQGGIFMLPNPQAIYDLSAATRDDAIQVIVAGGANTPELKAAAERVNDASWLVNDW